MAINLQKGQRVDIGLTKVGVGLGWDPNTSKSSADYDLDASAFMLGANAKIPREEFLVFYGNQESPDKAVASSGDDTTGGNSDGGDDETLSVDLNRLDPKIEQILFTVTIYDAVKRKQNFGQVRNSYIRIYDAMTQEEICKYELGEDFSIENCVEFGRLYKRGGQWRFEAIGQGYECKGEYGMELFLQKYT